jgi:hypothetical protein
MTRKMSTVERVIHLMVGIVVLGLYGALSPPWKYLTLVGLVPLGTAIVGSCPMLGWRERRRVSSSSPK